MKKIFRFLGGLITVIILLIIWFEIPVTEEISVGDAADGQDTARFALVTDLHSCFYGKDQKGLLKMIEKGNVDAVLLSGDILDNKFKNDNAKIFLEKVAVKYPCYYVTGNHEIWSGREKEFKEYLTGIGVTVLDGNYVTTQIKGRTYEICGVDDPTYMSDEEWRAQLTSASSGSGNYKILLSHRPERVDYYDDYDFDLVVSGHAHGGQWINPFTGLGTLAPDQGYWPKYVDGLYTLSNGTNMIVSRGLCRERMPYPRFFNHPEIVIIEVAGAKDAAKEADSNEVDAAPAEASVGDKESQTEQAAESFEDIYVTEYGKDSELFVSDNDEFYRNLLLTSVDAKLQLKNQGDTLENLGKIWNEKIENTVAALNASPNLTADDKEKLSEVMSQWSDFEERFHKLWYNLYSDNGYIHGSMYREMMTGYGAAKYELFEGALMALEYEVNGNNEMKPAMVDDLTALDKINRSTFSDYDVCLGIENGYIQTMEEMGFLDMGESEWRNLSADLAKAMEEIGSEDSDGMPYTVNYVRLTKLMSELEAGICKDSSRVQTLRDHRFKLLSAEMMNYVLLMADDADLLAGTPVRDEEYIDENSECYHLSLQRPYEKAGEYAHFYDGFFVNGNYIGVFYASKSDDMDSDRYVFDACDFTAELVDVTFDGNKDLVISLGHQGAHGTEVHCAYVYEDGSYVYKKSFEQIPDYSLDHENKKILGRADSGAESNEASYSYENGEFVEK